MKFWTLPHQVEFLKHTSNRQFTKGADRELLFHIGNFTNSYAIVEMRISLMLAKATGITQLQSFDLLTRGMDVRIKVERLRRACEGNIKIGPNLSARIKILDDVMRPLRNRVAHTFLATEPNKDQISFATLAEMPKFVEPRHPDSSDPYSLSMLELFEHAAWLKTFNRDLSQAYRDLARLKIFEIEHPLSPLLQGSDQSRDPPKRAAKLGKRERKRLRKGQPPRGKKAVQKQ